MVTGPADVREERLSHRAAEPQVVGIIRVGGRFRFVLLHTGVSFWEGCPEGFGDEKSRALSPKM